VLLEDRTLLASIIWDSSAGGDWDVASNWVNAANPNDHHVPTASDDATISQAGITVTHGADKGICLVMVVLWELWAIPPLESTMGGLLPRLCKRR